MGGSLMEASYAKEPFDLRLLLLRLGRNLWKILALTILGTVLFGGGYYVKNVLLQPDPGYAASSTYKVEYVENPNAAGAYYINEATWNSLLHTGEFLDGVETHLQEAFYDRTFATSGLTHDSKDLALLYFKADILYHWFSIIRNCHMLYTKQRIHNLFSPQKFYSTSRSAVIS